MLEMSGQESILTKVIEAESGTISYRVFKLCQKYGRNAR